MQLVVLTGPLRGAAVNLGFQVDRLSLEWTRQPNLDEPPIPEQTRDGVWIPLFNRDGSVVAYTLVDDCDAALAQQRWCLHNGNYAVRSGHGRPMFMHRLIADPPAGLEVDHINRNRLDNRRANLRVATRADNLPDPAFTGIVLTFDLAYENLQPIDSRKFATIDWPYLNCRTTAGALIQIPLFDVVNQGATQVAGDYLPASGTFTLVDAGGQSSLTPFDRVTLWYQNLAFDYIVPNPTTGVTAASIVPNLRDQINSTNWAALDVLIPLEATASGADLTITAARPGYDANMIRLNALHKNANLYFTHGALCSSIWESNPGSRS